MKPLHITLSLAAVVVMAFAALSASPPSGTIQLRYLEVVEAYTSIKDQLGPDAASALLGLDLRTNTLRIATDHPKAAKIRDFISQLDTLPPTVKVAATIKRIIPATPTTQAREEVLARPTVVGAYGKPMILSVGDPDRGTFQVELEVTSIPGAPR
jgi:hypothetical protein